MKKGRKALYKTAVSLLIAASMTATLPGIVMAGQTESKGTQESSQEPKEEKQIRGLNVLGAAKAGDTAAASFPTAVSDTDPMYWMGQRTGGDTNRAMVWFGEYWQKDKNTKSPLLWRTLRSDGQGNYGGAVTLLAEYLLNAVYFDKTYGSTSNHWFNNSTGSSDLRAWMNGVGTGAMDSNADTGSRAGVAMPYNTSGGGVDNIKGSFYANAFNESEKGLIIPTLIEKEPGYTGTSGRDVTDKIFALSGYSDGSVSLDIKNTNYFSGDPDRVCTLTPFASVAGNTTTGAAASMYWWLRSPVVAGGSSKGVVYHNGKVAMYSDTPNNISARVALNLSPDTVIFTSSGTNGENPDTSEDLTACIGTRAGSYTGSYTGGFRVFRRAAHPNQVSGGSAESGEDVGTPNAGY